MRRHSTSMLSGSTVCPIRIGLKKSTIVGTDSGKKYPIYVSPMPISPESVYTSMKAALRRLRASERNGAFVHFPVISTVLTSVIFKALSSMGAIYPHYRTGANVDLEEIISVSSTFAWGWAGPTTYFRVNLKMFALLGQR